MASKLSAFLRPRSIAVVGAGERPTSSGGATMQLLRKSGFRGDIYPVNPKGGTIFGLPAYTALSELPAVAELVVMVIRPDLILGLVEEAAASGHRNILILPGGFAEAGPDGLSRHHELRQLAAKHKLTIAGPNCAGIINLAKDWPLAPTFLRVLPPGPGPKGGIALISQSGALAEEVVAKANDLALPLSTVITVGNSMQLGIEEYLDELGDDQAISSILLYVESVADPAKLRAVARRVAANKPLVALFGGHTTPGALAAQAHTGAIVNTDAAINTFCQDASMIRVRSMREFILAAKGFGYYPQGIGSRVLVMSNSGGPGVLATDMASIKGLELPPLPNAMAQTLADAFPAEAATANPLDILADARAERFTTALATALAHAPGTFDAILGIHVAPFMVDAGEVIEALAAQAGHAKTAGIPFFHAMMGTLLEQESWFATMEAAGVPMFNDAEAMAECAAILARYPAIRANASSPPSATISLRARN
ncbi:MAG: CoA-binding protein [Alphaproteobacteria bacterium]